MFNWHLTLAAIAYTIAGHLMTKVVQNYINKLIEEVSIIDERYVDRMYFTIHYDSERKKKVVNALLFAVWPVVAIAAILKAERQYDIIVHHSVYRGAK